MTVRRALSRLLLLGALLLFGLLLGSATDIGKPLVATAETAWRGVRLMLGTPAAPIVPLEDDRFVDVAASDAATQRVQLLAPTLAGPVLIAGGRHRFLDLCPGFVGCVAVEYDRHGRFVHAYPFRPEAYEAALVPHGLAEPVGYERRLGFDFAEHARVFSIDSYSNGDLAVVFLSPLRRPYFLGIARIDREGRPRWFRADGSHHWPTVALVVPGYRLRDTREVWVGGPTWLGDFTCARHLIDYLYVIDGDGVLLRQIAIEDALANSRHAPVLAYSNNPCDPLHLNSVDVLAAAGPSGFGRRRLPGVAAGHRRVGGARW